MQIIALPAIVLGLCPMLRSNFNGAATMSTDTNQAAKMPAWHPGVRTSVVKTQPPVGYQDALAALDFDAVKAFGRNVCASSNGGRLTCWSSSSAIGDVLTPTDVRFDQEKWDVGAAHGCGIETGTGEIHCWGENNVGQASPPY